jgi:hypothetical protein
MWSANRNLNNNFNFPRPESEIFRQYHDMLISIEFEHWIKISHFARKLHVDFFRACFFYEWNLHWMQDYLTRLDYDMVYNIWTLKLDEIVEKEKDKIAKWDYLLWAYFNSDHELLRYIIWKRDILLTKIFNKVKNEVRNIGQTPCRQ